MNLRGYSWRLVQAVDKADPKMIGVRLAKYCINNGINVSEVAGALKVSRMTIYAWFIGRSQPHANKIELIKKYLGK